MAALTHRKHVMFWRAAVSTFVGISVFTWPVLTLALILMLFGLFAIADGAVSLVLAVREVGHARSSLIAEGVFGLVSGAVVLLVPRIALAAATAVVEPSRLPSCSRRRATCDCRDDVGGYRAVRLHNEVGVLRIDEGHVHAR